MGNDELLHPAAMARIERLSAAALLTGFDGLAKSARDMDAETATMNFDWLLEGEEVAAAFVPRLILSVVKPGAK